jgi:hypothetical protein
LIAQTVSLSAGSRARLSGIVAAFTILDIIWSSCNRTFTNALVEVMMSFIMEPEWIS